MLSFAVTVAVCAAVGACYGATLLALIYALFIRDAEPGERTRIICVGIVTAFMGITLHVCASALIAVIYA